MDTDLAALAALGDGQKSPGMREVTGKPLAKNYLETRFGDASRPVRLRQHQCHYWVIELRDESRAIVRPFVAFAVPTKVGRPESIYSVLE